MAESSKCMEKSGRVCAVGIWTWRRRNLETETRRCHDEKGGLSYILSSVCLERLGLALFYCIRAAIMSVLCFRLFGQSIDIQDNQ